LLPLSTRSVMVSETSHLWLRIACCPQVTAESRTWLRTLPKRWQIRALIIVMAVTLGLKMRRLLHLHRSAFKSSSGSASPSI
ncbi:unnamed protein product, partial [Aphanomyces euteiches]